jgi:hypothetical protein
MEMDTPLTRVSFRLFHIEIPDSLRAPDPA